MNGIPQNTPTELTAFVASGKLPPTHKERSSLLDQARHFILQNTNTNQMTIFKSAKVIDLEKEIAELREGLETAKHQQSTAKRALAIAKGEPLPPIHRASIPTAKPAAKAPPAIHRAAVTPTATAKPATVAAPPVQGLTTAEQFAGSPLVMVRSEFDKLNPSQKSNYFKQGGKLIADPKPAKPAR